MFITVYLTMFITMFHCVHCFLLSCSQTAVSRILCGPRCRIHGSVRFTVHGDLQSSVCNPSPALLLRSQEHYVLTIFITMLSLCCHCANTVECTSLESSHFDDDGMLMRTLTASVSRHEQYALTASLTATVNSNS